jgi:cyclic pyranopterin phosphate synthase
MYCMPRGKMVWIPKEEILSYEKITRLASIMSKLGIEKIRVTGGEPLFRPQIEKLVSKLSQIEGIKSVSMTTNGLLLQEKVKVLKEAGLENVNVSLDSFRAKRFRDITGVDGLEKVISSMHAANDAGIKVKINTVVIRGWNDDEVTDFARFARETGYTVRFIEFMPVDGSNIWRSDLVVSKKEMIEKIRKNVKELIPLNNNPSQPARLYSFGDGKGEVGFIPSMTEPFCGNCDRIRITSDGRLLTCLFENPGYDLKNLLRSGKSDYEIGRYIKESVKKKPEGIIKIIRRDEIKPALNLMHKIGG